MFELWLQHHLHLDVFDSKMEVLTMGGVKEEISLSMVMSTSAYRSIASVCGPYISDDNLMDVDAK